MKILYYKTKEELLQLIKDHDLFEEQILLKCISDFKRSTQLKSDFIPNLNQEFEFVGQPLKKPTHLFGEIILSTLDIIITYFYVNVKSFFKKIKNRCNVY